MSRAEAFAGVVAAIRHDMAKATQTLMTASEAGLRDVHLVRAGDTEALSRLEEGLLTVLQVCALEDLIGQRLTQLEAILSGGEPEQDALENGPAQPGQGLKQAEIDAWLDGAG